ncbi:hypothetical protein CCZ01_06470 [Helicobacter monodelphidis]|nr:hypothetical protein CCZ01_06470 [Helicobacter sp. 15-1451]
MNGLGSFDQSMAMLEAQKQKQAESLRKLETQTEDEKLREQTDAFEAILVKTLLDQALNLDDGLFPKAPGHDIYQSMYKEQLSEELAGGFGYSDTLFNWLKEQENILKNGGIYKPEQNNQKSEKMQDAGSLDVEKGFE